ncbi:uncharacterized protein LOC117594930 [Esox lucius]|uniref:uncharacterized protein LOC117594930 n=1 Tax=Esox lucius TaxID=8010 RepID=UPI0014769D20|nr:uncharacterized protein LOC117594930 [Esox lucius]
MMTSLYAATFLLVIGTSGTWGKPWYTPANMPLGWVDGECPAPGNAIVPVYCAPQGNGPTTFTVPLLSLKNWGASQLGSYYVGYDWYSLNCDTTGYWANDWEHVHMHTAYPNHKNQTEAWEVAKETKQVMKVLSGLTIQDNVLNMQIVPVTVGCIDLYLRPDVSGKDPWFPITVCITTTKIEAMVRSSDPYLKPEIKQQMKVEKTSGGTESIKNEGKDLFGNWLDQETDPEHPFSSNVWYRYATWVARQTHKDRCYVCSYIPQSVAQPRVFATPMVDAEAKLVIKAVLRSDNTTTKYPLITMPEQVVSLHATMNTRNLVICNNHSHCHAQCVNFTGPNLGMGGIPEQECATITQAQTDVETQMLDQVWWMCGWKVHAAVPRNGSGMCAPVTVSDHTYIFYQEPDIPKKHTRKRRSLTFIPHDSIWGSDVPP